MLGRPPLYNQETGYSCAPACLRMVLESFGTITTEEQLRSLCDCKSTGTDALSIVDAAKSLGFSGTRKHSLTFEELREAVRDGLFPILYIRAALSEGQKYQTHAVVVDSIDPGGIHLVDPWRGRIIYDVERLKREWEIPPTFSHGLTILVARD